MTAVEWLIKGLQDRGVDWMATLCGHGLDPLFHAAKRAGLRLLDTRNEQAAGYLADAYGKLTRRPGVCAVSSGLAHVNALSGVVNAFFDSTPMLLISGAAAVQTAGMGHFQDLDQVAMARPVTKFARFVDCPERILHILDEAWTAAVSYPPGPVHLTIPMDVQTAEVPSDALLRPILPVPPLSATADLKAIVEALATSRRPLIVAGGGVFHAGVQDQLLAFSERFSVPVVVPIWDRGTVDRPASAFMGVIGAATGGPRLLPDADLILMAQAQPDYRVGYLQPSALHPGAEVAFMDHRWSELTEMYGGSPKTEWLSEATRRRDEFRAAVRQDGEQQAKRGTHAIHIVDALREVLNDETALLIDGGSIGQWAHQLLCDRYPGHWLTCGRSAVVGWGLAGAMAARIAYPARPVILLSGDGAFTFTVAELECAVRQKLHFVAIVADDQGWGITRAGHQKQFGEPIASSLGPIDFARLAESLGARGVTAHRSGEILPHLRNALAKEDVTVIHVPVIGGSPTVG